MLPVNVITGAYTILIGKYLVSYSNYSNKTVVYSDEFKPGIHNVVLVLEGEAALTAERIEQLLLLA